MRQWIGSRIVGVLLTLGGVSTRCAAADDGDSQQWHVGGSFSYLVLFKAETDRPLYSAQVQYEMRPPWTLEGAIGLSRGHLGLRESAGIVFREAFHVVPFREEHSLMLPVQLGATRHLQPVTGMRHRGYVGAGISLFTVSARDVAVYALSHAHLEHKVGWLIGPFGTIGMVIPVQTTWSVDLKVLEFTYHRAVNPFLRSIDGLVFGAGIGIRR